jgi:prevent-host-death family protein
MTHHVPYNEFSRNIVKFMDEARSEPVYVDRSNGTTVLVSKEQFDNLKEMARHRRGSEGLLATVRAFGPLDEDFPEIPNLAPGPVDL